MARVAETESHQKEIDEQRQNREQNSDRIDQKQERREQCRPGNQRHPQRHHAERFARVFAPFTEVEQLTHSDAEQNQAARDLEIGNRDPQRAENNFAEKDEPD